MDPLYKPQGVEERWQRTWEEEGLYNAEADDPRRRFAIAHPPPNVTGDLHLGHALQLSLADTIVRTRRMQGYNVLFQPGFDHAGISTQNAVEKHLATEGKTRQDLGREAFEARVWEWLREYGGKIMVQFRRIGASLDYRRERFTMDEAYVRAVMHFFVHLYRKGYIYRANRIINWCPFHQTALSDLELTHEERDDALTYVLYAFDGREGGVTIATARVPTILADVAVAVNPADERWSHAVGAEAAGARCAARTARPLPPRVAAPVRDRLARERTRLEHLAPALVGPSAACLVLPGRARDGGGDRAAGVRGVRLRRTRARRGRA